MSFLQIKKSNQSRAVSPVPSDPGSPVASPSFSIPRTNTQFIPESGWPSNTKEFVRQLSESSEEVPYYIDSKTRTIGVVIGYLTALNKVIEEEILLHTKLSIPTKKYLIKLFHPIFLRWDEYDAKKDASQAEKNTLGLLIGVILNKLGYPPECFENSNCMQQGGKKKTRHTKGSNRKQNKKTKSRKVQK